MATVFQADSGLVDRVDQAGGDARLAGADRLEEIAVGNEAKALLPGVVGRREVGLLVAAGQLLGDLLVLPSLLLSPIGRCFEDRTP